MRRIFIATLAVAMLAFPATASAALFKGHDSAGGTVRFRTVKRHGRIVKVKRFAVKNVPMHCDEGDVTLDTPTPYPAMHVNRMRKFSGEFVNDLNPPTQHSHVSGRFRRSLRKARGTFEFDGAFDPSPDFPLGLHHCATGDTHFRVHRV